MPPATIRVVVDTRTLVGLVSSYLEREGVSVVRACDGRYVLDTACAKRQDPIVLDLMPRGIEGLEVCRQSQQPCGAYVLVHTARGEEIDRNVGLTVDAGDSITKPLSPRTLVARVRATLSRPRIGAADPREAPAPLRFSEISIDDAGYQVMHGGEPVYFAPMEFKLLVTPAAHPGRVFTGSQLIDRIWGQEFYGDEYVVDIQLGNLRKKLETHPAKPRFIETIRGVGWRIRPAS